MNKRDNIETAKTEERKHRINWNKWDTFFLVLPIIFTILVPLQGLPYLCGRLNYHMGLVICMLYPAIGIFIICCFFAGIVRLLANWTKNTWKKKIIHVVEISIPIVFIVLSIVLFFTPVESYLWPPGNAFTYGFRDRIKSKADIPAIRDWLKTLNKEDYDDYLPYNRLPESLKVLNPFGAALSADKNGNPLVRITWGAHGFHWGLTIGMEDMKIPASDLRRYEGWLLVEPGVYVWDS